MKTYFVDHENVRFGGIELVEKTAKRGDKIVVVYSKDKNFIVDPKFGLKSEEYKVPIADQAADMVIATLIGKELQAGTREIIIVSRDHHYDLLASFFSNADVKISREEPVQFKSLHTTDRNSFMQPTNKQQRRAAANADEIELIRKNLVGEDLQLVNDAMKLLMQFEDVRDMKSRKIKVYNALINTYGAAKASRVYKKMNEYGNERTRTYSK